VQAPLGPFVLHSLSGQLPLYEVMTCFLTQYQMRENEEKQKLPAHHCSVRLLLLLLFLFVIISSVVRVGKVKFPEKIVVFAYII
jgi:hypothetical protein